MNNPSITFMVTLRTLIQMSTFLDVHVFDGDDTFWTLTLMVMIRLDVDDEDDDFER